MPSKFLPLVCIHYWHHWHLLLLRLGFSTKPHRHCLQFTCFCGLCHHPSNSDNLSGHYLAGCNKTGCWSSCVSFVASFSSVQFCHPCHLSSYSRLLCPLIWTWNSTMLSSPSPASCRLIDHRAFYESGRCAFWFFSIPRPSSTNFTLPNPSLPQAGSALRHLEVLFTVTDYHETTVDFNLCNSLTPLMWQSYSPTDYFMSWTQPAILDCAQSSIVVCTWNSNLASHPFQDSFFRHLLESYMYDNFIFLLKRF